ncbi:MAG: hypothetical protein A2498_03965 [Lentisphaerae bacterium RIFOXYC12_FULL_60_16]|nr:MAG: hypothetical protein A2498_03965 [Lentisphaerae bacterium RIFOXYC12_FULL_60_16]OGV85013.1 MAG: hypothetical protein A2340_09915 [Lentisphaerae bacterium RIFOXYB12_FULL_60_10]
MVDVPGDSSEIKETDIVFDCPHCGKSLAIDYRGAGLSIPCSDCGKVVEVPIPDGMELADIDSNNEEQEVRILNLRRSLAVAESRAEHLESELESVNDRREKLEASRSASMARFGQLLEKINRLHESVDAVSKTLQELAQLAREGKNN